MNFLSNCLKGIAIGSGAILPGISSGVFCVIFGIYEKLLDSVLGFFHDIKNNFKFLFPITLGISLGVILFGNILSHCLYVFPIQTKSIFIGLILGSIPTLVQEVNHKKKFKFFNLIFFFCSFLIGLLSIYMENFLLIKTMETVNFSYLVLCGFLVSIGIIVPGVSSTVILMLLGIYPIYLSAICNIYLPVLIPIGIGIIFGSICIMKITKYLLNCFYSQTFYCIIGFTFGSIFVLLPNFRSMIDIIIGIFSIILGFFISSSLKY